MFPEMTPAVVRALESAVRQGRQAGSAEVLPLYLLHGLLEEQEGRAAILSCSAGLDDPAYRLQVCQPAVPAGGPGAGFPPLGGSSAEEPPKGGTPAPANTPLPLHPHTFQALRLARELAVELTGERTVASEVLLLALLRTDAEALAQLERFGLKLERLEALLQAEKPPPVELEEPLQLDSWTEPMDLGRILDASANRAREGLRVVEDYCRFVLDDAFLTGQLKQLRHDLSAALSCLPAGLLLQSRETQTDVGTLLTTESEQRRWSALEVAQASLKRLQEALRSLEEYGKVPLTGGGPELGSRLEEVRYRVYTLERAIVLGTTARERLAQARLYVLLSGQQCVLSLERTIKEAALGGASIIQLREKELNDRDLWQKARQVRQWTREAGVLFVVNDRPDLARLVDADGVHLGQDDLPVKEARRILGPDLLVGVSTHNIEQVRQAILDGASYIGMGAAFPTETKAQAEYPGLEFIRQALAETTLPAFAIGGINMGNIGQLTGLGVKRVAVSSAVARADEPQATVRALRQALG